MKNKKTSEKSSDRCCNAPQRNARFKPCARTKHIKLMHNELEELFYHNLWYQQWQQGTV